MPFFKYFLVECSNYKFLIESNRARTYFNTSTVLCDTSLSGWYRFSGRAGNQMADSCVDHKHCGTDAPGWISGGHPSVADRVVSRIVCFRSISNCCKWSIVISVRNCGGFYVYWLQRPPHCNFRYCGSGIQPTSGTKCELYRLFHVAYRAVMAKKKYKKVCCTCRVVALPYSNYSVMTP